MGDRRDSVALFHFCCCNKKQQLEKGCIIVPGYSSSLRGTGGRNLK